MESFPKKAVNYYFQALCLFCGSWLRPCFLAPETFYKKAVLKNFVILTGKHLCWNLFLIKLQAWRHLFWRKSTNSCFCYEGFFMRVSDKLFNVKRNECVSHWKFLFINTRFLLFYLLSESRWLTEVVFLISFPMF